MGRRGCGRREEEGEEMVVRRKESRETTEMRETVKKSCTTQA